MERHIGGSRRYASVFFRANFAFARVISVRTLSDDGVAKAIFSTQNSGAIFAYFVTTRVPDSVGFVEAVINNTNQTLARDRSRLRILTERLHTTFQDSIVRIRGGGASGSSDLADVTLIGTRLAFTISRAGALAFRGLAR